MSSETLENEKPQGEEEAPAEDNHTIEEKEAEKKEVDEIVEEESDQIEEEENEEEEDEEENEESPKVECKRSMNESGSATPASERPTRERKTVDRYNVSSPEKFRSSSFKALEIEKGNGTQLKDIPNVAFNLLKRKPDDNLRALHNVLFAKKAKAHYLKRNIGLFSGYVWNENEEKQRAKIKERIDKCVKEKLVDFCNVLNIPINKTSMKKEDLSAKLLEFLESPHATTDILLADKEKKGKKRGRKVAGGKSSKEGSETPAKKQKQTSQVRKKRKRSSDIEDDDTAEPSDAVDSQEDDVSVPESESDHEESKSENEEDNEKAHKRTSKKAANENKTTPVKIIAAKTAKSKEKTPEKSTSKKTVTDNTKQSASKKQKTAKKSQNSLGKTANKKQSKSSKALVKDQVKGKSSEKGKAEPSRNEIHQVVVDILKEVDFNKATLSDILKQLGTHFDLDLMHRKAEVKDIITDVINSMSDEDGEEAENVGDDDADEDDA